MNCWHSDKLRHGLTLVEVVVGLVLMASVLVSSLLAVGAQRRQQRTANEKLAAVTMADELLTQFLGTREGIPLAAQGPIAGRPQWSWQTRPIGVTAPAGVPMQVIRLQILAADGTPYATVDVVRKSEG